ncbi:hypothetical protein [Streptomyces tubercidicus]|uniref:hypothetical protein n=1 Tax=Streptomyces tubercidicus TaxID=47759 RepID=UPI0036BC8F95
MNSRESRAGGGAGTLAAGWRHLKAECGRWWRADDQSDTHIAHRLLNEQYRIWARLQQRGKAEVQQNLSLLKSQQRQATAMQMQRMAMQKRARSRGYGGYFGGGMGASPTISYRMMQWAELQLKMGQKEFQHLEITPQMLSIGRGQIRSRRHWSAAGWLLLLGAAWALLWGAAPSAGAVLTAAGAVAVLALTWAQGRRPTRRRPPVQRLLFVPPTAPHHADMEADPEPFPIRDAGRSPREARESVRLALKATGAPVAEVSSPREREWGWTVPLVLSGTLGDLVRLLPRLAATLRVGANRLAAQPADPEDSAAVTLRVLLRDPFADAVAYPKLEPRSRTITDEVSLGPSIEGDETPVILAGQHVIITASSGGGKSSMIRRLAEHVTACVDAVVVDVDPTGRGLGPLRRCAARGAYTPEDAERELGRQLQRARARIAGLGDGVDDNFAVGASRPAIIVFVDEFRRLTTTGKERALALLEIGRKARVTLVLSTTDATADALSDAVADGIGVRIMMPCRSADVPIMVGRSDAIGRGWLPHVLVPSPGPDEPADAGQFYAITPRHREPILRYVPQLAATAAAELAQERVAAGLCALPDVDPPPASGTSAAGPAATVELPPIAEQLLGAFAAASDPEWLTMTQIADHLAAADPARWGRWEGRPDRLTHVGKALRSELRKAGLDGIPRARLGADVDVERPTVYRLADIREALPT